MSRVGWRLGSVGFVLVLALTLTSSEAQPKGPRLTPWEWEQQEVQRYFEGLREIQTVGWGPLAARVNHVIAQLIQTSGMVFRVVPAQTFSIGQAHVGGWILLDLSTARRSDDELAFWLAHEWGHLALGHQPNIYHPVGQPWRPRYTETADEDAADEYGGRFVCAARYDIHKVMSSLRRFPKVHADRAHSDGPQRARSALAGYRAQGCSIESEGGEDDDAPIDSPKRSCRLEPCRHAAHPTGDQHQCQHQLHPMGDAISCTHMCAGMYGYGPCHQFDVIPCSHPAHAFDVTPCTHALHPQGDTICD